jgi:hypothetical protein
MESFPTRGSPDPWRLSIDAAERLVADVVLLRRTRVPTLGGSVLRPKAIGRSTDRQPIIGKPRQALEVGGA